MFFDPTTKPEVKADPIAETLIAARKLIENPENWCQDGMGTAEKPCAIHAINLVQGMSAVAFTPAQQAMQDLINGRHLGEFNDRHDHAELLALFDRAIARRSC